MNYAAELIAIRELRERKIAAAQREAKRARAELARRREAEILRLADQGYGSQRIAREIGCCQSLVYEVRANTRAELNERRARRWHERYSPRLHAVA